jgi:NADH-ubiquinone oxidoreductase chain 3
MTSVTFFFIFIPILSIILLGVNLILAPHNPYQEKDSVFECGFHSFLGQNRTQFNISFFIFGLLFLLFDLEILLVYPYIVSAYINDIYGLMIMLIFFLLLTLGFAFELGKNALKIDSRQNILLLKNNYNKKVNHKHSKTLHSTVKNFLLFSAILHSNGSMTIYIIDPKIVLDYIYSIIPSINTPSIYEPIYKSSISYYKIPIYTPKIGIFDNPMLHNSLYASTKMVIFNISNNMHSSI